MARKSLPYVAGGLYHVRAKANHGENFYIDLGSLWEIFLKTFEAVSAQYHAHVISFVLMSNHYHLLIETPDGNLGPIMNYLQREVSRLVGSNTGRKNHLFGGNYRGTLIENEEYLYNVYRYVYQNPVAAGICERVDQYRFSTLQFLLKNRSPIALSDYIATERAPIPEPLDARLRWLNALLDFKQRKLIRNSLRRSVFRFPKSAGLQSTVRSLSKRY